MNGSLGVIRLGVILRIITHLINFVINRNLIYIFLFKMLNNKKQNYSNNHKVKFFFKSVFAIFSGLVSTAKISEKRMVKNRKAITQEKIALCKDHQILAYRNLISELKLPKRTLTNYIDLEFIKVTLKQFPITFFDQPDCTNQFSIYLNLISHLQIKFKDFSDLLQYLDLKKIMQKMLNNII
jgi:hypothetical protein